MRNPPTSLILCCLLALTPWCCSTAAAEPPVIWRASVDNGDKPGVGVELVRCPSSLAGTFYVLDPNKPHDFRAGLAFPTQIERAEPEDIFFTVRLSAERTDSLQLHLTKPWQGERFDAVLISPGGGDGNYEFRRVGDSTRGDKVLADAETESVAGSKAGDERQIAGLGICWCPAGKFTMGSPPNEPERRPGEVQVEVTHSRGFWMSKYETTQGDWKRVVGKLPGELTAELPAGDDYPVGNVSFAEAEEFCRKLTESAHASGDLPELWEFRLPTEAQWEYACRAGTTTAVSFGDRLSNTQANFQGKPYNGGAPGPSLAKAAKVGQYPANAWGLHDMHGNTYEWCRDWYHRKLPGGTDPDLYSAKSTATKSEHGDISRVRRGGCWADEGRPCRSAFRLRFEPERRWDHIGFRVVAVGP